MIILGIQTVTITNRTNGRVSVNWHVLVRRTDKSNLNYIEDEVEVEVENRGREVRGNTTGNERNKNKNNFDFQGSNNQQLSSLILFHLILSSLSVHLNIIPFQSLLKCLISFYIISFYLIPIF